MRPKKRTGTLEGYSKAKLIQEIRDIEEDREHYAEELRQEAGHLRDQMNANSRGYTILHEENIKLRQKLHETLNEAKCSCEAKDEAPFYWAIGYFGWGSFEDDVLFLDGDSFPTAEQAVAEFQEQIAKNLIDSYDWTFDDDERLLVYRIDEIGMYEQAVRWVPRA